jgi:hypothetical protein
MKVLILPRLKTTRTPQIVTSSIRVLIHYAVTKSVPNKIVHRGQVHDLPVKFSTLSRNTSAQINTAMSPHTRQILPLVPRPRKVRKKGRKTVKMGARVLR